MKRCEAQMSQDEDVDSSRRDLSSVGQSHSASPSPILNMCLQRKYTAFPLLSRHVVLGPFLDISLPSTALNQFEDI